MKLQTTRIARRLAGDKSGAIGVLVGVSLPALIGATALAVDLGSLYLAQRQLQGIADAAAMAATQGDIDTQGRSNAEALIAETGIMGISINDLTPGAYYQDKMLAPSERFDADAPDHNAARIELTRDVPMFFGKIFDKHAGLVRAKAVASKVDYAGFSLGSRLASLSDGLGNQILSQLIGSQVSLSVMDYEALLGANIDLLGYADALKARVGGADGKTYGEVFDSEVSLQDAIAAIGDASGDADTAAILQELAALAGAETIQLSELIDLGIMGDRDYTDGDSGLELDAFTLVRALLERSAGESYVINLNLAPLGIANATAKIVGGAGMTSSPWLTVTSAQDYVIRTSQMRVKFDFSLAGGGAAQVKLPLYVELAEAEARLSEIQCTGDEDSDGVTLQVTPSPGTLAIANVDMTQFADLGSDVTLSPVAMLTTPLARVNGFAEIDLGGTGPQPVHFTPKNIEDKAVKTVSTDDTAQAVASSLAEQLELTVQTLGLGISVPTLTGTVTSALTAAAPALDAAIFSVLDTVGLKVGAADVRVDRYRCGLPTLVA